MRTALQRAQAIGLTRVELTVREDNKRVAALYEKVGFVVEGLKRNAVRIDGEYINYICMAVLFEKAKATSFSLLRVARNGAAAPPGLPRRLRRLAMTK